MPRLAACVRNAKQGWWWNSTERTVCSFKIESIPQFAAGCTWSSAEQCPVPSGSCCTSPALCPAAPSVPEQIKKSHQERRHCKSKVISQRQLDKLITLCPGTRRYQRITLSLSTSQSRKKLVESTFRKNTKSPGLCSWLCAAGCCCSRFPLSPLAVWWCSWLSCPTFPWCWLYPLPLLLCSSPLWKSGAAAERRHRMRGFIFIFAVYTTVRGLFKNNMSQRMEDSVRCNKNGIC